MASSKKLDLGPTGRRVARAVQDFRERRGKISVYTLSKRLEALGVRILPSGITRIEREERRVSVDDLVALALALEVAPNALLLPREANDEDTWLTPNAHGPAAKLWNWATGEKHVPDIWGPEDVDFDLDREALFYRENRPHRPPPRFTLDDIRRHGDVLRPVRQAVRAALDAGIPLSELIGYVEYVDANRRAGIMARRLAGDDE